MKRANQKTFPSCAAAMPAGWMILLTLALLAHTAAAQTTAPATRPEASAADLDTWLAGLADPDPSVRDQSRLNLLQISPDALASLHDAVAKLNAVEPAQAEALQDIVEHVYLKGVAYEGAPNGFLGLSWKDSEAPLDRSGVVVEGRLPGFDAYGVLEPGDLILGMGNPLTPITTHTDLTEPVRHLPPGTVLTLRIRRGTTEMTVDLTLGRRPLVADDIDAVSRWETARTTEAQNYWDKLFAPLMNRDTPVAGS